jgi:pyruvate-formate lyase-activating enzyme
METAEKIEKDLKELQEFLNKKTNDIPFYIAEFNKNISTAKDEKLKAQLSILLSEAMKGNKGNVDRIVEMLKESFINKK